jgi:hypothetical protein
MNTNQKHQQFNVQSQPTRINPVVSHPMQHHTPDQPEYTNSVSEPMQIQTIPPIHNNPCGGYSGQQSQRLTSTSEEDKETHNNSKNEWQVIRSIKRNTIHRIQSNTPETNIETYNRYDLLTNAINRNSTAGNPSPKNHKPPPIFVHGVINYGEMTKRIRDVAEDEQYCTKRPAYNVIKNKLRVTRHIQKSS